MELREIAIKQNTIIYLPTGSGKTFIAVLVLKHLSDSLSKSYSEGGKISFVVVNTVALVDQHAKCLEKRTALKIGRYSGELGTDIWPKSKWYDEFNKYNVFVMTVQILVNITNQNFLDLNQVNLIVFDECHRGVSDQPMRQLCKSFKDLRDPPRVLGLTATLLNGNCKPSRVMEEVKELEVTYHSKVATVDGLSDVSGYSTNPIEKVTVVTEHVPSFEERKVIAELEEVKQLLYIVKEPQSPVILPRPDLTPIQKKEGIALLCNTIDDVILHIKTLGIFGGNKGLLAHIIQIERLKKHCSEANLHIVLSYVQTVLSHMKKIFDKVLEPFSGIEKVTRFSSDKVKKLISIFTNYSNESKEELCALVFTKRRFTAKVLFYIFDHLSKHCPGYSHIKTNFMVGYNNNPYNDTRESLYVSKKNKETLQSFDNKETNVLMASNVLEEGVDISTCSLVIKFNYPEDYRSYIQSKGRARNPSSLYYMIVEESSLPKFQEKYLQYQKIESILQDFLVGQNKQRSEPSQRAIDEMYNEDQLPPYYVDGPNSAKVDMVSAVSLLCSYCNSLPCDRYTDLTPAIYSEVKFLADRTKLVRVVIVLPTICPLTEPITGVYMRNIKQAKRAAALKACELLHKAGELDDHLLPKVSQVIEEDVKYLFGHHPKENEPMAGTNKNKRQHKKLIPNFLQGGLAPNKPVYLHIIHLQPEFERREELMQSSFYDIYTSDLCYGLITPNAVPTIADFPIYVNYGTLTTKLDVNVAQVVLTEQDIVDIKTFNFNVFSKILDCLRHFLIFDNGRDAECMILVPVEKNSTRIDFDVLRNHKQIKESSVELTREEKLSLNVTTDSYLKKIVSPWYRDMGDYLVTEVSLNKSAQSPFPNYSFASYEDYFDQKHSVKLVNPSLPLLFVKGLTKKTNFIKPLGELAKRKKEKNYDFLDIHLIPELVVKQDFPSSLWIQASLLPTIISRLSFMFRLELLRSKIATETKLGQPVVMNKKPLELDRHLLTYEPRLEKPKTSNVLVPDTNEEPVAPALTNINVNKDYTKKMLELEYPWKDSEEPKDIERNLNVTVLEVDYYEKFISKPTCDSERMLKNLIPMRRQQQQLALTYLKDYVEKPIMLLEEKSLDEGPELCVLYKAMTTAKANDIVNMERLETLGDSFLKLFSSMYIYLKFPKFNEGSATQLKGRLVSNINLYYLAKNKNIAGIMKVNDLQMVDWLPPGFKIPDVLEQRITAKETSLASIYRFSIPEDEQQSGVLSDSTIQNMMDEHSDDDPSEEGLINDVASFFKSIYIGDKKVADCVEALLGAYFQTTGIKGGIRFMEWMNIIPPSENLLNLISRPIPNPVLNDKVTLKDINRHIPRWQDIEDTIGYHFKNPAFLLQALTHASYSPNRCTMSYERLEFLGDAILDFLITCYIFETGNNLDPGDLTDLRSALVNNNTFASLAVRCNLHKHFLCINNQLQVLIDRFAQYIESKKFEIDDEVLILLEEKDVEKNIGLKLAEYIDVPKALGDIFEALAGAVYLDSNKDLKTVWKVFHRIMWKEIEAFSAKVPKNLVRRLYEWTPDPHPNFGKSVDLGKNKVMVPLQFMLNGRKQQVYGFGSNKVVAKKAAAKLALRQLTN